MRVQLFFLIIGAATLPYVAHARHIKPEVLKAMHNGATAASFHIRPTYTDDEDIVATQRWLLVASL